MNANEDMIAYSRYKQIGDENLYLMEKVRQQQVEIEALKQRIERMIEKQSHYEAMAHAGGFEAGRQQAFFDRAREVAKQIDNNEYHTPED